MPQAPYNVIGTAQMAVQASPLSSSSSVTMQIPCQGLLLCLFVLSVRSLHQQLPFLSLFLRAVLQGPQITKGKPRYIFQSFAPAHPTCCCSTIWHFRFLSHCEHTKRTGMGSGSPPGSSHTWPLMALLWLDTHSRTSGAHRERAAGSR